MRILIACEYSGIVRDAFIARGHDAVSCDLLTTETPGPHIQGNVLDVLDDGWDMMIAHPPCTYLCSSGLHWNHRRPEREVLTLHALAFVEVLWGAKITRVAIENPRGCISTRSSLGKATQTIHPHQYGHDASKATCLWLRGLPKLVPTKHIEPRIVDGKPRWANQTDSGQNRLGPSPTRGLDRAKTYHGIAIAMADQWLNSTN